MLFVDDLDDDDVKRTDNDVPMSLFFIRNDSDLDEYNQCVISLLVSELKAMGVEQVKITGHASQDGDNEVNMALSQERADSVAKAFQERDMKAEANAVGETENVQKDNEENTEMFEELKLNLKNKVIIIYLKLIFIK